MQNNRMGGMIAVGLVLLVLVGVGAYFFGRSSLDVTTAADAPQAQPSVPAPNGEPASQWTTSATHENWLLRCRTDVPDPGPEACVGVLELINEETNQLVLAWLVAPGADGALNSTFQTLFHRSFAYAGTRFRLLGSGKAIGLIVSRQASGSA